jgi:tetratricopeptide (TPR) repeat protein
LQKGDELFRRGQFAEALDAFTEQLAASSTEKNSRTHKEALLKTASCFVRLNRPEDARRSLMELSQSTENDPIVVQAKFQLWTLLLSQEKYSEADALCQTLRLQHPLPKITGVISKDMRQEIFFVYSQSLSRRRHLLQPGIADRLAALQDVARYFEMDESALDGARWQFVTALRMRGRTEESLPHLLRLQQVLDEIAPRVIAINADHLLEDLRKRGYIDRALGQPSRMTEELPKLLESTRSTLEASGAQTLPSVNAWLQAIKLEQIRILAAEDRWSEVVDRLQPMMDEPAELIDVIVDGGLLLGFAYHELGKVEQANQAWQKAAALMPQDSVFGSDLIAKIELVPRMMWLRGLSGDATEEDFRKDLQFIQKRLSSMPGTDAILDQFPVSFDMMKRLCHSESGYQRIQQSAMGNSSVVEDVGSFLILLASQMMWEGAFGEPGTDEQREATSALAEISFHAYVDNQLALPTVLQLGLAWKGLPAPLGWQFLLSSLPETMRPEVAYVLGKRFERKQNQEVAKVLWQLAVDHSPADSKVHQLAKAALELAQN